MFIAWRAAAVIAAFAVWAIGLAQPLPAVMTVSDMANRCERLASVKFDVSRVTQTEVLRGAFTAPDGTTIKNLPNFCRVVIHTSFSADSSVNSEVWLPLSNWNQRFLGTGNGAMAGSIRYELGDSGIPDGGMVSGLRRGFVVANTDMGTHTSPGERFAALGHPVKWWDYGRRSTHEMTVLAKALAQAFYGKPVKYSYFAGCSTGGFQALRSVQDFPDDYDGILAGHPGPDRSAKLISILYNYMLPKLYPEGRIPNDKLMLMHKAVLAECAGVGGGLESDPFLSAPQRCTWKPEALLCKVTEDSQCLTQAQVDMANRFYFGLQNPRTKEMVWPGQPRGTELGWVAYMAAADAREPPFADAIRSILGPQFDFWTSDWDRDVETYVQIMGHFWNTQKTDLSAFEKRGGKMLMYFGWNDTSSAFDTINYYEAVRADIQAHRGLSAEAAHTAMQDFYRLFMMPGVEHCGGGNGPNTFDGLTALTAWVERGISPDSITASWKPVVPAGHLPASLGRPMSRPLCPYPQVAHYKGQGDPSQVESFDCRE